MVRRACSPQYSCMIVGNTTKVFLNSSKEVALEVNSVLCKWIGKWLPFACRTEIIRVSLGGFRGGCREIAKWGESGCVEGILRI